MYFKNLTHLVPQMTTMTIKTAKMGKTTKAKKVQIDPKGVPAAISSKIIFWSESLS